MTAIPVPRSAKNERLRVLKGRRIRKVSLAPWMIMVILAVVAFLGLGFARTSLDRSAFQLDELDKSIAEQAAINQSLRLELARLENPARIAPLAEELGMVLPDDTKQLLVDLDAPTPLVAQKTDRANQ